MAELNIDSSLIDTTGLVQSDEMISMSNGCVCCTLKGASTLISKVAAIAPVPKLPTAAQKRCRNTSTCPH